MVRDNEKKHTEIPFKDLADGWVLTVGMVRDAEEELAQVLHENRINWNLVETDVETALKYTADPIRRKTELWKPSSAKAVRAVHQGNLERYFESEYFPPNLEAYALADVSKVGFAIDLKRPVQKAVVNGALKLMEKAHSRGVTAESLATELTARSLRNLIDLQHQEFRSEDMVNYSLARAIKMGVYNHDLEVSSLRDYDVAGSIMKDEDLRYDLFSNAFKSKDAAAQYLDEKAQRDKKMHLMEVGTMDFLKKVKEAHRISGIMANLPEELDYDYFQRRYTAHMKERLK